MNLKEIVDLCKAGRADEAYAAALADHSAAPDDHYALVGLAYGTKAMMEKAVADGDADALARFIKEYGALRLEEIGEADLNNRAAWEIRAMILKWKDAGGFDMQKVDLLFDAATTVAFVKPHRYYSVILDAFLKIKDDKGLPWHRLPEFVAWWGLENLLPEDYERVMLTNGQYMPSLAERAYTATLKALAEEVAEGRMLDAAESMLADLEALEQIHPEYDNILYRKAKLLKAMGRTDEAFASACAYARRRPGVFSAWSALGDVVDDDHLKAACYSRAVLCKTDLMFQVKVRYKLAVTMYNIGEYANSKREFEKLAQIYESKEWHMPPALKAIREQQWYLNTYEADSNRGFYNEFGRIAESLACQDVPPVPVLINMVNPQKMLAGFITADRQRGFFPIKKLNIRLQQNGIYNVRFEGEIDGKKAAKVIDAQPVENVADYENVFYRRVNAEVGLKPGQTFQFVDDIYIDGNLLRGIRQPTMAEVTAVLYYNIKKESWGWRAVRVRPVATDEWKE